MNSVERVKNGIENKLEEDHWERSYDDNVEESWPQTGKIDVCDVKVRYRDDLPLALNGLSFEIGSKEKVGIVGRTGSGKSTTMLILMRILELEKDEKINENNKTGIFIDGIDISKLGLHKLRNTLSIIPQEPFLFEGTLKSNIDPYNEKSDQEIYNILEEIQFISSLSNSQIENKLKSINGGEKNMDINQNFLEFKIDKKGKNLSLGQRQLVCIARSILENRKIILMDEATSSIDQYTDSLIQKIISEKMKKITVVSIAHRLKTIMNYDKIIVMENGRVVEIGSPVVLSKSGGKFSKMLKDEGIDENLMN